jgi:hypothetical protein
MHIFSMSAVCFFMTIALVSAENTFECSLNTFWESQYVAEGREELDEGGLFSTEVSLAYGGFELGAWAAVADSVHYQQLDLSLAYGDEFYGVSWSVGYTHLEFEPGSEDDDELATELETELLAEVIIGAVLVYSFEADGCFLELTASRSFELFVDGLTVTPYGLYAFDFGYRTEDYNGANHVQLGIECEYALADDLSLIAYAAHSFAREDIEREGLGDLGWVGFGLSAVF